MKVDSLHIRPLSGYETELLALADLLVETAAHGGLTGTIIFWKRL